METTPRLVGVPVAADHDRLAAQLGVAQHLDGGDELIQINVQYPARHASVLPVLARRSDR